MTSCNQYSRESGPKFVKLGPSTKGAKSKNLDLFLSQIRGKFVIDKTAHLLDLLAKIRGARWPTPRPSARPLKQLITLYFRLKTSNIYISASLNKSIYSSWSFLEMQVTSSFVQSSQILYNPLKLNKITLLNMYAQIDQTFIFSFMRNYQTYYKSLSIKR